MHHRQRMLAGLPYQAWRDGLPELHQACLEKTRRYNLLPPSATAERDALIRDILGSCGQNIRIEAPFFCDYGQHIHVGDNFFANYHLTVLDVTRVSIGHNVLIGPNCSLYCAGHPVHPHARAAGWEYGQEIHIGNAVWLGGNTVVNPGVSIGDNTVIGSGSVVTRSMPANVIAAGNPCRVLRPITEEDRRHYFRQRIFDIPLTGESAPRMP